MQDVVIVAATRTAIGSFQGALANIPAPEMGAAVIRQLLALWRDRRRSSATVKKLALAHVEDLEAKIAEMQSMVQTLKHLAHHCHGDDRPDCPILEDLAS